MSNKENSALSWKVLSVYRGQIMGLAIIWIMLFHWPELFGSIPVVGLITKRGMAGVEIFLLVSGIGLYNSMSKKADIKEFYIKRGMRVLLPYLVLSIPFWIWQDIWLKGSISEFFLDVSLLSFWKDGNRKVWYIGLILILYLVYPFIYHMFLEGSSIIRKSFLMGISLLLPFMIYWANPSYFPKIEIAVWRISSFILGSLLAVWVIEGHKVKKLHLIVLVGSAAGFIVILLFVSRVIAIPQLFRIVYLPVGLLCCMGAALLLRLLNCGWLNVILNKFGACSLELYLIHIFLRTFYQYYVLDNADITPMQSKGIACVVIILSIALSFLAHRGLDKVKLNKKKDIGLTSVS